MKSLTKEIRAYALKNAIEFGKAEAGRILPKLFQHGLDRKEIKSIMPEIESIVSEVNKLGKEEKKRDYENLKEYVKEKADEEKGLPELPNASDKMVFRLAPYPSGALHLGNTKTYLLNALYAEKYKAKTLLIMDDTIGSEEKRIVPDAYGLIEEAFKWLGVKYEKPVIYKSDRVEIYYNYAEELIEKDKAYVCKCIQEVLRKNREEGKDCKCRKRSISENKKLWKEMFKMKQGEAVLRIKTSMQDPNPAFRDRVLFKISDNEHPRVGNKYRVWPSLEMSWTVDDHLLGITHILRGNDLMIETDMEKFIWDIFGWKHPEAIHTGMIKIEGVDGKLSKSKAQKEVQSGEFTGWEDPRTWSMQSLRRRGIKAEAIREFVEEIGLNKQDIIVPIDSLYAHNRKMIDNIANRYSFVNNPVRLKINGAPEIKKVEVPIHPDREEKREIKAGKEIFISKDDFDNLKGQEIRLLHLYNIKLGRKAIKNIVKSDFTSEEVKQVPKINWVSVGVKTNVLKPDGTWIEGIADEGIRDLKQGTMIQFERFGFCRFHCVKKNNYEFWFAHK